MIMRLFFFIKNLNRKLKIKAIFKFLPIIINIVGILLEIIFNFIISYYKYESPKMGKFPKDVINNETKKIKKTLIKTTSEVESENLKRIISQFEKEKKATEDKHEMEIEEIKKIIRNEFEGKIEKNKEFYEDMLQKHQNDKILLKTEYEAIIEKDNSMIIQYEKEKINNEKYYKEKIEQEKIIIKSQYESKIEENQRIIKNYEEQLKSTENNYERVIENPNLKIESLQKEFNMNNSENTIQNSNLNAKIGLENLGNTCYINSIIQCLSHSKHLCEYFSYEIYSKNSRKYNFKNKKPRILKEFTDIIKKLCNNDNDNTKKYITPSEFIQKLGKINAKVALFS